MEERTVMALRKWVSIRPLFAAFVVLAICAFTGACGSTNNGSAGATASAGGSKGGPLTTVRVGFVAGSATLPIEVAIDEGIFKKNGLHVDFTKTVGATNAAIGPQFDIGQSTATDFLASAAGGLDDVLISNMIVEGADTTLLLASKKSEITSLKDMEGKTLGVASSASGVAQAILYLLRQAGVNTNTVKVMEIPFPTMADQLKAGRVNTVGAIAPFSGQVLATGDAISLGDPLAQAYQKACGCSDTGGVLFATSTRAYAKQHPEVITAWRKSISEAGQFIKANPAKATKILAQFVGIPAAVAAKTPLYATNASPVTPTEIADWIKVVSGGDLLKNPAALKPENLVYAGNG
jgi:NitT/TauT family transport system substrate-binding protein